MKIGVLGGGQLGRMLALAGYPLGFEFRFLDPAPDAPAGRVAPLVVGAFDDPGALERFADGLDVVTWEIETVPAACVRELAKRVPVHPAPAVLEVVQDRLAQKQLLGLLGIPVAPYAAVDSQPALNAAIDRVGLPAILKTCREGYDGRGQQLLCRPADAASAWKALGGRGPLVLERQIPFRRELSILAVRGLEGREERFYPLAENFHRGGILRTTLAPAPRRVPALQVTAEHYARKILEGLNYVGILTVELFEMEGGVLLVNEIAARVHNSGHWTLEGSGPASSKTISGRCSDCLWGTLRPPAATRC